MIVTVIYSYEVCVKKKKILIFMILGLWMQCASFDLHKYL